MSLNPQGEGQPSRNRRLPVSRRGQQALGSRGSRSRGHACIRGTSRARGQSSSIRECPLVAGGNEFVEEVIGAEGMHFAKKNYDEPQVDFLQFRLNLAVQLIGNTKKSSRGHPQCIHRSEILRLDSSKGHLPEVASRRRCIVCCKVRQRKISPNKNTGMRVISNTACMRSIFA